MRHELNHKCNWFLDFCTRYDAIKRREINLIYSIVTLRKESFYILWITSYPLYFFFFLILLKVALLLSKKLKSVNFLARISSSDLKNVCLHHRDIFFLFLFTFLSPSGRTCLNYDVKSAHHIFANPRNLIILWEKNIRI